MAQAVRVWGNYACFTRPESKVERITYNVPTPSACKGVLDSIYCKPQEMEWIIDKIHVLNPINHINITRNEIGETMCPTHKKIKKLIDGKEVINKKDVIQRNTQILTNVDYIIEAHFELRKEAKDSGKYVNIWERRLKYGQCYQQPYLGCREFSCYFKPQEEPFPSSVFKNTTIDLGLMLHSIDYNTLKPRLFNSVMTDGIIDVNNAKILECE